jgi:nicotinate-nucleotide adenylyltransferase
MPGNRREVPEGRFVKFHRRAPGTPSRVAVFPGSFNPPTVAHLALAEAALTLTDEVVFVLPETFPHKDYSGVDFNGRLDLLLGVTQQPRYSVASTAGGLFIDMARDLRPHYGNADLHFLCGRDAAERIVGWDYGEPDTLDRMFRDFGLLVAARDGHYQPPAAYAGSIVPLQLQRDFSEVSATQVRRLVASGGDWRSLIPDSIWGRVPALYRE